ncbi:MAG: Uma2 family endonuclease, partial [Planctomycetaceae bacterium]
YHGQRVYITGNLLLYYVEGDPTRSVAPDAFVVKGIDPGERRTYKTWVEGKVPDVVFETTSDSTRRNDTETKFELYAELGIGEYFLYDPTGDYLTPPLRGYRLSETGYIPIEPDRDSRLVCEQLDVLLELDRGRLVMRDRRTGEVLKTDSEAAWEARDDEHRARVAAEEAREVAEQAREEERRARAVAEFALAAAEEQARRMAVELERLKQRLSSPGATDSF